MVEYPTDCGEPIVVTNVMTRLSDFRFYLHAIISSMTDLLIAAGWVMLGVIVGSVCAVLGFRSYQRRRMGGSTAVADLIKPHFRNVALDTLCLAERQFPFRVRADVQRGIDGMFGSDAKVLHFCGVRRDIAVEGIRISDCMTPGHYPVVSSPPQYEEIDVGEAEPVAEV